MEAFLVALASVWADSGFSALTGGHVIMIIVGLVLLRSEEHTSELQSPQ